MHEILESIVREVEGPDKAVIVTDAAGRILSWSRGAEELYGWSREEVIGRHILGVTPTQQSMGEGARILSFLQAGVPWQGSYLVQTRSGEQILAEVIDIPVGGESGELLGIVGISRRASEPTP